MPENARLYKIIFMNQGHMYVLYARNIYQSDLYGFIEVEDYIFGEQSQVVIDPGEERLKTEFEGVFRSYVPIHAVVRIDEVQKEGQPRVVEGTEQNLMSFPLPMKPPAPEQS